MDLITVADLGELDVKALTEAVGISAECGGDPIVVIMPHATFEQMEATQRALTTAIMNHPMHKELLSLAWKHMTQVESLPRV